MRIVETSYGKVQGQEKGRCIRYLGIPYAKPAVGRRRFMPPEMPDKWEGVRVCDTWPKSSPQIPYDSMNQSGDCLALNIWVPDHTEGAKQPVMVWIHGGSYSTGSTTNCKNDGDGQQYDAEILAQDTGCIIVTINYRLNVLGFLDLTGLDPEFTRNNGLRDVVAALRWVHDNIHAFDGDPENVTVFGQSAGGGLTLALLCVPEAQPYFQKLICESSGDSGYYTMHRGEAFAQAYLKEMGNPSAEQLVMMSEEQLVSCNQKVEGQVLRERLDCAFCPIVDEEYLIGRPSEISLNNCGKKLLIGWNNEEASVFMAFVDKKLFQTEESLPIVLPYESEETRERIAKATSGFPDKKTYTQLATERMYSVPITFIADHMSSEGNDVYVYRLDYAPLLLRIAGIGPCHSSELPLLFGQPMLVKNISVTGLDKKTAEKVGKRLRSYWGSFARNGRPDAKWIPYDPDKQAVMRIGKKEDMILWRPMKERAELYREGQ